MAGFYEESILPNGVRVITETMPSVRSVALGVWVDVGTRDENPGEEGMSHFLEHMLFKGTARRSAADISYEFDGLGAELNAFTTREHTCFYARFLDEHLEEAVDALADMVARSVFPPEEVESEREVVLEEIASCEDDPGDYVFDLLGGTLFAGHPLGRPILGTQESVEGFTREGLLTFYRERYAGANLIVAAAGHVDHARLVELCERHLGDLPAGMCTMRDVRAMAGRAACSAASGRIAVERRDTEQSHVAIGLRSLSCSDPDRYAASLFDIVFGDGTSSRLFQEVREKRGLAYEIESSLAPYRETGAFTIYAGTRPDNLEAVLGLVRQEAGRMVSAGISADELERARSYAVGQLIISMEATHARMARIGRWAVEGVVPKSLDESIAAYEAVTVEDVNRVARRILSQQSAIAVVSPADAGEVEQIVSGV